MSFLNLRSNSLAHSYLKVIDMSQKRSGGGNSRGSDKQIIHRSSVDGRFVTEDYAKKHPKTTEKERR